MDKATTVWIITIVIGLSLGLLAWFFIDIGTTTLAKYKERFTYRTAFQAQEFFLFIDPNKLFLANLCVMFLGGVIVWVMTNALILAVPAFLVLALFPRWFYKQLRQRRLKKYEAQLPDTLMSLVGGLRAGSSLSMALQQLVQDAPTPTSQEFSLVLREQRLGVSLSQSLQGLGRRMPTQSNLLLISAMQIALETGGGLAETLERTAETVRLRLQMESKIDALTSQGRMQAWIVGMLPIGLMLVLNKMEPEAMSLLWNTPIGWGTLGVIAFLETMGIFMIRKIVAVDI